MTDPDERREEFFEECVTEDEDAGAVRLDSRAEQRRKGQMYANKSARHREAVNDHLEGTVREQAISEGYYAMLHKANQAVARGGFEPKTHHCTLRGIRGLFNAPDLADDLRRAWDERENVDYRMDPEDGELEHFTSPDQFVEDTVDAFLKTVDELVDDIVD